MSEMKDLPREAPLNVTVFDLQNSLPSSKPTIGELFDAARSNRALVFDPSALSDLLNTLDGLIPTVRSLDHPSTELFKLYDSAVEADNAKRPFALTSEEIVLWTTFITKLDPFTALVTSYMFPADPHPLDGQFEPFKNYSSSLTLRQQGGLMWDFSKGDFEDAAITKFFCCLQLVEDLEDRRNSLGKTLTVKEAHVLSTLIEYFSCCAENHGIHKGLRDRIDEAIGSCKTMWLSHRDAVQVLSICGGIPRPKPKKGSTKNSRVKYTCRSMSDILIEESFYSKLTKAAHENLGLKLTQVETSDLMAFTALSFEIYADLRMDPKLHTYSHPQALALSMIEKFLNEARFSNHSCKVLVFPAEEAMAVWKIVSYLFNCWRPCTHGNTADEHQKDIFKLYERVRSLIQRVQDTENVVDSLEDLLPGLKQVWKHKGEVVRLLPVRIEDVREQVECVMKERDEATKESNRLRKSVAIKDKKLEEKDALVVNARDLKGVREEKLREEVSRLESELSAANRKLEDARGVPDKVRNEFSAKVQRLHDKVAAREKTIANSIQAHESTKELDEKTMELKKASDKIVEQEKLLKKYKAGGMKLKKELDELKTLHAALNPSKE